MLTRTTAPQARTKMFWTSPRPLRRPASRFGIPAETLKKTAFQSSRSAEDSSSRAAISPIGIQQEAEAGGAAGLQTR